MSEQKNRPNVLYLCDERACDNPCNPACKYTSDPAHAMYFQRIGNGDDATYWERESLVTPSKSSKVYDNVIPVSWIDEWSLSNPEGTVIGLMSDWIIEQREKWNPLNK